MLEEILITFEMMSIIISHRKDGKEWLKKRFTYSFHNEAVERHIIMEFLASQHEMLFKNGFKATRTEGSMNHLLHYHREMNETFSEELQMSWYTGLQNRLDYLCSLPS